MNSLEELLTRGVVNVIPNKNELLKKLTSGEKLNVYLGIDPTATHIHLGHAVILRKLQKFAEEGHHVTFLIGDFTALIGDTSDKDTERPTLSKVEIESNFQTYKQQAERVLNFSHIKVTYNSEWLHKLNFEEIIKLCQHFSTNDFLSRELIRKRLDEGKRIGLHEFLYPVMQGYDSYHMNTDLQIGGADQTFNMQAGRTLMKDLRNKESFVLAIDYLLGTDGRKMSKSWGNAIWLDDLPEDMFAQVMAINDELIVPYYTLATEISLEEIEKIKQKLESGDHPMPIKKDLAYQIVGELYDEQQAQDAKKAFEDRVQGKALPDQVPTIHWDSQKTMIDNFVEQGLVQSKSHAKMLHEQNGIHISKQGKSIQYDLNQIFQDSTGIVIKIGKNRVYEIK